MIRPSPRERSSWVGAWINIRLVIYSSVTIYFIGIKETKSATLNIFRFFYFLFKSFVKVELSYVFTIHLFTIAENCTEK